MKKLLLSTGILTICMIGYSQVTFEKTYGGIGIDQGQTIGHIIKQLIQSIPG
jgi:hypothetical protein